MHIRDFQRPETPVSLHQAFDEAYYALDRGGSLRLVLRTETPSQAIPTESITQLLLAETFWRPIPGTTYAESSMINARLTYLIRSGPTTRAYEGNGFVSFREDRRRRRLTGRIESASLRPAGQSGNPPAPFGPCQLEGSFQADNRIDRATALFTDALRTTEALRPAK